MEEIRLASLSHYLDATWSRISSTNSSTLMLMVGRLDFPSGKASSQGHFIIHKPEGWKHRMAQ